MLLRDSSGYSAIYLACGATDLRKFVDGLAGIVKQDFKLDPLNTSG
jgi:transposase